MHQFYAIVTLACTRFTDEGIMHDMFTETKVFRVGEIAEKLCKKVADFEVKVIPITLPKVLEDRIK